MSAPPKENAADRQDLQREGVSKQLPPRSQTRLLKLLLDSAPEQGGGLNDWLMKGARMCSDLEPDKAHEMLAEVVYVKGGEPADRAIWRVINKVHNTDYSGPSRPKWPEPNLGLIEELTLLRAWDVLDALAALIFYLLMKVAPLAMVTFSGSCSLHSWWYCEGESEHVGSPLHNFMEWAATLGADTALFCPSQFARMPSGKRQTGELQTVHYLNLNITK